MNTRACTGMSPAAPLLAQLQELHRHTIFPNMFEQIRWDMVAAFETSIRRTAGVIHVVTTTFWMTPDKDARGQMTIDFADQAAILGRSITQDALTQASGQSGDATIVFGYAPTAQLLAEAVSQHDTMSCCMIAPHSRGSRPVNKTRGRRGRRST